MKRRSIQCLPFAIVALLPACSSSSPAPAAAGDSGIVGCQNQGDVYSADMAKPGTKGKYTFTLAQAAPAPPTINTNVWTMTIADATGASPAIETLSAYPYMPLMGHPSGQTPQFAANADGTFAVSDIDLFMNGLWTVTFSVTEKAAGADGGAEGGADGGASSTVVDSAVFTFCIDG